MSKALLLSVRPKWVAKILNGEKTIEVRKRFPEEYKGWVYIYCTKDKTFAHFLDGVQINGKVVARFYCDKVDEWDIWQDDLDEKIKLACLSIKEFDDYSRGQVAYAIHISQLEIFDKPKELSEFEKVYEYKGYGYLLKVTKAPQNYCYVEVEE